MNLFPPLPEEITAPMLARHFRKISARELDVLLGLARAQSNKALGAALGISPETIETHVRNITQREVYRAFILQARGEQR